MSRADSPSTNKPYSLARVCRAWRIARSGVYHRRKHDATPIEQRPQPRKRGPQGPCADDKLVEHIRREIETSPFHGEGHRKIWARLRFKSIRTSKPRVLRLMREHGLLATQRSTTTRGPRLHDGTIIPDRPDAMWGTDMTETITVEQGRARVFACVDHYTGECLGIHAASRGTRFEALEPVRQAVKHCFGKIRSKVVEDLKLRHDHGSQYLSDDFQNEIAFLGIESSPAFVRAPEGNGCVERFFRTLKENLLWLRAFEEIEDLRLALQEFQQTYNTAWIMQRHGYKTPAQVRAEFDTSKENPCTEAAA